VGALDGTTKRVRHLEALEDMIVDTVANLAATYPPGIIGRLAFATDGRRYVLGVLEGPGAGSGVLTYDDSVAWIAVDSGSAVLA